MGQRTPLYDLHLALGAKMVDFGGWDMPLHYGSQVEEHHQVRRECGVFDVSHMCVMDVSGSQAKAFLQRLLANDVARLESPGKALYSAMLNEQGGVIDDLIAWWSTLAPVTRTWRGCMPRRATSMCNCASVAIWPCSPFRGRRRAHAFPNC